MRWGKLIQDRGCRLWYQTVHMAHAEHLPSDILRGCCSPVFTLARFRILLLESTAALVHTTNPRGDRQQRFIQQPIQASSSCCTRTAAGQINRRLLMRWLRSFSASQPIASVAGCSWTLVQEECLFYEPTKKLKPLKSIWEEVHCSYNRMTFK